MAVIPGKILLEIEVAEHARPFRRYQNNRFASSRTIEQDQYNRIVLHSFVLYNKRGTIHRITMDHSKVRSSVKPLS